MKRIVLLIVLCIFATKGIAQNTNECTENIDFLIKTLEEKSPAYKNLIIDRKSFALFVDEVKKEALDDNKFSCSEYLQKILRNVGDGHLQILYNDNVNLKDSVSVKKFLESEKFNSLPRIKLENALVKNTANKPLYYSLNDDLSIYIVQEDTKTFKGYVKETNSIFWEPGELILQYTNTNSIYEGVIYSRLKNPLYYKMDNLESLFKRFNISKFSQQECGIFNHVNEKLSYKIIDDVLYVSFRSFQNLTQEENKEFENFINSAVIPNYNKYENILFDVRNNSGGAMVYHSLTKFLKKDKNKKNIYVLQNRKTASAAELFILQLKNMKDITTIGENTRGMVAFRDINVVEFPKKDYRLWLPIKIFDKNYKDLLKYEHLGIAPDVVLEENQDWLSKAINIMKNKN